MKTIKKIFIGFSLILFPFIFVACDSSDNSRFGIDSRSNSSEDSTTTNENSKTVQITVVDCDGGTNFTTMQSGDTLIKTTTPTTIDIRHLSDGTKKVCVLSGSAYVER